MNFPSRLHSRRSRLSAARAASVGLLLWLGPTQVRAAGTDNTATGTGALPVVTGSYNTADGFNALNHNTGASYNTAVGFNALLSDTTSGQNTALGANALQNNTTGHFNTATGVNALQANTAGVENIATGQGALARNTTGGSNTAVGFEALFSNTTGAENTVVGDEALLSNATGSRITAMGFGALGSNTTNDSTAYGHDALGSNTTGVGNMALGSGALASNKIGNHNTATGYLALHNSTSDSNTATGYQTLYNDTTGDHNTTMGFQALFSNTTGCGNAAYGWNSLSLDSVGSNNTGYGHATLYNCNGDNNVALGYSSGANLTTGSNNIDIGNLGIAGESSTIRIGNPGTQTATYLAGVTGVPVTGVSVIVNSKGQLGIAASSARFKDDIHDMSASSEALYALRPVGYHYRPEIDPAGTAQFGLIAEEVEKVAPALVVHDEGGKPFSVRYEQVNAMLLNEFLKEHARGQTQTAEIAALKAVNAEQAKVFAAQQAEVATALGKIKELTASLQAQAAQLQKVSIDMEAVRPAAPRVAESGGR